MHVTFLKKSNNEIGKLIAAMEIDIVPEKGTLVVLDNRIDDVRRCYRVMDVELTYATLEINGAALIIVSARVFVD